MQSTQNLEYPLHDEDFAKIATLIRKETGIVLSDQKRHLVYSRLVKRLRVLQLRSFAEYCALVASPRGAGELGPMTNAITTNLTSFFRENHHFEHLTETVLKPLKTVPSNHKRRFRIWSAGCSSGEEPYSIAMTLRANMPDLARWDARILATDIDTDMVARASAGRYPENSVSSVPPSYRSRYLDQNGDETITVTDEVRKMITFRQLNLLESWPMSGPFDAIFCRNVAIYFDKEGKRALFDRYADMIAEDGWLYIGHSESMSGISDRFRLVGKTIYRKIS